VVGGSSLEVLEVEALSSEALEVEVVLGAPGGGGRPEPWRFSGGDARLLNLACHHLGSGEWGAMSQQNNRVGE
jgi:hypothetical protein